MALRRFTNRAKSNPRREARATAAPVRVATASAAAVVIQDAEIGAAVQAYSELLDAYGSGEVVLPVQNVSADTAVASGKSVALADATTAPLTVTLPPAAALDGRQIAVKKVDASGNAVTIEGDSGELIDGAATFPLAAQGKVVTLVSHGGEWYVVAQV